MMSFLVRPVPTRYVSEHDADHHQRAAPPPYHLTGARLILSCCRTGVRGASSP